MNNQSLLETLADISYIAGAEGFYGGDSREDIQNFIAWAKEFEELHSSTEWLELNYIEEIENFTDSKIQSHEIYNNP